MVSPAASKIPIWLKKRKLSYEWVTLMLMKWRGVGTSSTSVRVAVSRDINPHLLTEVLIVMDMYDTANGFNKIE